MREPSRGFLARLARRWLTSRLKTSIVAPEQPSTSAFLDTKRIGSTIHIFTVREYSTAPNNKGSSAPAFSDSGNLFIKFDHGLPTLSVPLPSRKENCQFILRPISDTVGTFCDNLIKEDNGIEIVALYNIDGTRISKSTNIQHLLRFENFRLRINDSYYDVSLPVEKDDYLIGQTYKPLESEERMAILDDLKAKVSSLYAVLNVDDFKVEREKLLLKKLEEVEIELRPMEIIRKKIEEECHQYSIRILWFGFIALGLQTGIFARLTWWEYSWDIVEPVTYFATFSTVFATFAYYLLTTQNFEYTSAHKRLFTQEFYRRAKKYKFDVLKYNALCDLSADLNHDLKRLRDPLLQQSIHINPVDRFSALESEKAKLWGNLIPKSGNNSFPKTGINLK